MTDDLEPRLTDLLAERGAVEPAAVDRALAGISSLPDRRRRAPLALAAAAVLVVAVLGITLAMLLRPATDVGTQRSPAPPVSSEPARTPGSAVQSPPVWAADLTGHLDCDGPPSTLGMETDPDPVPFDPWATPAEALDDYVRDHPSLPVSGYTPALVDGHWALQRYLVDGRAKVHAVSTNQFPGAPAETRWQVIGIRACDPSEFAASAGDPS